jgi:hypothetical protein
VSPIRRVRFGVPIAGRAAAIDSFARKNPAAVYAKRLFDTGALNSRNRFIEFRFAQNAF